MECGAHGYLTADAYNNCFKQLVDITAWPQDRQCLEGIEAALPKHSESASIGSRANFVRNSIADLDTGTVAHDCLFETPFLSILRRQLQTRS